MTYLGKYTSIYVLIVVKENKKPERFCSGFFRGVERIRTAVEGFADLCLATRPRRHKLWIANLMIFN